MWEWEERTEKGMQWKAAVTCKWAIREEHQFPGTDTISEEVLTPNTATYWTGWASGQGAQAEMAPSAPLQPLKFHPIVLFQDFLSQQHKVRKAVVISAKAMDLALNSQVHSSWTVATVVAAPSEPGPVWRAFWFHTILHSGICAKWLAFTPALLLEINKLHSFTMVGGQKERLLGKRQILFQRRDFKSWTL